MKRAKTVKIYGKIHKYAHLRVLAFKRLLSSFISTKLPSLLPTHHGKKKKKKKRKKGVGGERICFIFILQFIPNVELAAVDFCMSHYKRKMWGKERETERQTERGSWGVEVGGRRKVLTKTPLE